MKNRRTLFYVLCFIIGWLMTVAAHGNIFDPDVKNGLKKTKLIKDIKFDTKKQICLIEYISIEVHPSQLVKIVKNAGYEVKSIRWLKDKKPNRYNKP